MTPLTPEQLIEEARRRMAAIARVGGDKPCTVHEPAEEYCAFCQWHLLTQLADALTTAQQHSGQCAQCGTWTCGFCGSSDEAGAWRCERCLGNGPYAQAIQRAEAAEQRIAELEQELDRARHAPNCTVNKCAICQRWLQGGHHVSSGPVHPFRASDCTCASGAVEAVVL